MRREERAGQPGTGTGDTHSAGRREPLHTRPLLWAVVAAGGALGTAVRDRVGVLLPHADGGWPLATLLVNVAGCLLLGVLLEALARAGSDAGGRQLARLAGSTGFCGGLTTWSSLALEVVQLVQRGAWPLAAGYAVTSVLTGLVAVAVGITTAARWHGRRPGRDRLDAAGGGR
jgi:CrcB protein